MAYHPVTRSHAPPLQDAADPRTEIPGAGVGGQVMVVPLIWLQPGLGPPSGSRGIREVPPAQSSLYHCSTTDSYPTPAAPSLTSIHEQGWKDPLRQPKLPAWVGATWTCVRFVEGKGTTFHGAGFLGRTSQWCRLRAFLVV